MTIARKLLLMTGAQNTEPGVPPCPSGEQIINGNFEGGNVGWSDYFQISTTQAHSPTHSYFLQQTVQVDSTTILNIKKSCIASFGFWMYGWPAFLGGSNLMLFIHYTDGSTDTVAYNGFNTWTYMDALPYVDPAKIVQYISFKASSLTDSYIDDVSLIGTG